MSGDRWLAETYFDWLRSEAFSNQVNRKNYEGVLRVLHDIPFYWTMWADENRAGEAQSFRQYEFLSFQDSLETLDQVWLGQWATASPSVLEVLVGMARRWSYYFGAPVPFYFGHMFRNLQLDRFSGRSLSPARTDGVRTIIDDWLSRQFEPNGNGSPFPIKQPGVDMRTVEIWAQMNAYSAEHFQ